MKSTVGVAMGAGADVARESANVVLIGNDLSKAGRNSLDPRGAAAARSCRTLSGTLVVDSIGRRLGRLWISKSSSGGLSSTFSSEMTFILNSAPPTPHRSPSAKKLVRGILSQTVHGRTGLGDKRMSADSTHLLATKRLVIGHLTICQGCLLWKHRKW